MKDLIYLDNNATTKVDPRVRGAMLPFFEEAYANPQSTQYALGRKANHHLEESRETIAALLHGHAREITFTSGATETINMALKGVFQNYQTKGKHIITVKTEHKATLLTLYYLEKAGAKVTYLPVNIDGSISLDELTESITDETILVSIMAANNETGVLHPIQEIAEICQQKNTLFFCDATQWVGKLPLNLKEMPIDMLCLSSHKHHGPKGVGLFYKREKSQPIQIPPLIIGGQQENGMRGGTHNMASIVGMAKALELSVKEEPLHKKTEKLRDYFEEALLEKIPHIVINGKNTKRIFNTTNITFKYARASQIIIESPQIAMSTGSACVTGSRDPSHVLRAMGVEEEDCFCSLRFSLSKWTTRQEVEEAIRILEKSLHKVRSESPLWSLFRDGII